MEEIHGGANNHTNTLLMALSNVNSPKLYYVRPFLARIYIYHVLLASLAQTYNGL